LLITAGAVIGSLALRKRFCALSLRWGDEALPLLRSLEFAAPAGPRRQLCRPMACFKEGPAGWRLASWRGARLAPPGHLEDNRLRLCLLRPGLPASSVQEPEASRAATQRDGAVRPWEPG